MKEGDYVRTDDGIKKIRKYEYRPNYENCHCIWFEDNSCGLLFADQELYKCSNNIIDLIEIGDYVNGIYVDKYQGKLGNFCELPNGKWEFIELLNEHYFIASIVTKEQFESMEYKV